ncbi:MAG: hypothetical protein EPO32_02555 [Anaerolineae bacterium]|nr:MAG: hypothetical protein EPO32_02555 [Anaerolineae bacterium]
MFVIDEKGLELRPIPGSRRPELMSWGLAVLLFGMLAIARPEAQVVIFGAWALGLFFGLSALVMTLGNWLERNTLMILRLNGITLRQPVQSVMLNWQEVDRVEVQQGPNGERVFVRGGERHFSYRPATRVEIRGKIRDQYGFENSEKILKTILTMAKLPNTPSQLANGYSYARD